MPDKPKTTHHDERRLPKWARQRLAEARHESARLKDQLEALQSAHCVLEGRGWFTIPGPKPESVVAGENRYYLFYLSQRGA